MTRLETPPVVTSKFTSFVSATFGFVSKCNSHSNIFAADFCPELADPIGGTQQCKDWGSGGQFKVCEISCNRGLKFSKDVPTFYTCGAEGFWRPTQNPTLPLVYPACTSKIFCPFQVCHVMHELYEKNVVSGSTSAQRVFKINMNFPTSVLCNEAGQGVLKQKVRHAVNSLNRDWNFCSYSFEGTWIFLVIVLCEILHGKFLFPGTRECKDLNIEVQCDHRTRVSREAREEDPGTYAISADVPVES